MRNGKPREERAGSVKDYLLRPMQISVMLVKAVAVLETWREKKKGKMMKDDEIAEIGIVPVTEIGTGIGTGIGIGIETGTGIGIGIVTIEEVRGQDHVIVMDIADVINIARGQGTVVVHAHVPKSEVIVNDQEAEVVRNVVQRATDHPNSRMPTVPTMTDHLVNTRPETELSLKQWRAIIMMIQ